LNKEIKKQYRAEMRLFGHKPGSVTETGSNTAIGRCECCSVEARFKKHTDGSLWYFLYYSNSTTSGSEHEPDPCDTSAMKKFDVGYRDMYQRTSSVHIFAVSEAHARSMVEKNGVGWENNGKVFVEEIKHIRLAA